MINIPINIHKKVMNQILPLIKSDTNRAKINKLIQKNIEINNGIAGNIGYPDPLKNKEPYPYASVIAVNHEDIHQYPTRYRFKKGDIVRIDFSVKKDGWWADSMITKVIDEDNTPILKGRDFLIKKLNNSNKNCIYKQFIDLLDILDIYQPEKYFIASHYIGRDMHATIEQANLEGYLYYCYEPIILTKRGYIQYEMMVKHHIATKTNEVILTY